jgi:putative ABC transport system permease protein
MMMMMMMFWRVLRGSLRHQWRRLAVATLAVVLGASLTSALVNLSFDVSVQAGRELRAYGANMVLLPAGVTSASAARVVWGLGARQGIPEADLVALDTLVEVVGYTRYLYLVADIAGQPVVVAGSEFEGVRTISPWWRIEGRWPEGRHEGLVGARVARVLELTPGDRAVLEYGDSTHELTVAGIVETGGAEESQILLHLPAAQSLAERPGEVDLVQVSATAGGRSVEEVAATIQAARPGVEVQPLQRFTRAENLVLNRIRRLMALVAALVVTVAVLTVGSTMVTVVLERRAEIGLMKGLGARGSRVAAFFLAEGLSMGLVGGLLGYGAGLGMAAFIGRQVFQANLSPTPVGLPATLAVALGVVLLASLWPLHRAVAVDPAVTLRGE